MLLKIKELRNKKKLTQDELCEIAGIKKRSLLDYESGKTDIPFSKLHNIAIALNVSIYDLFEDAVNKSEVIEPKTAYQSSYNEKILLERIALLTDNIAVQKELNTFKEEKIQILETQLQNTKQELENCLQLKNIQKASQ